MLTYQEIDAIWASNIPAGSTGTEWRRSVARAIEQAATAPLLAAIEDQKRTIIALNSAINGSGSTTTENLTIVDRLERRIAHLEATASTIHGRSATEEYVWFVELERDAARWRYALADGGNQRMNWLDVYDDWDGDGDFADAIDTAMKEQGHV